MPGKFGKTTRRKAMAEQEAKVMNVLLTEGTALPWLRAGWARGGDCPVGGLTWLDWNREFVPIPGLNQIVGHTRRDGEVRHRSTPESDNWCIDSGMQQAVLVRPGNNVEIVDC